MLQMLLDSFVETQQKIETAMEQEAYSDLVQAVHKLHGACCYAGVPKLQKLSNLIESGLKESGQIAPVEPELFELIDTMQLVTDEANEYL